MSDDSPSKLYPKKIDLNNCDKEPIHLIGQVQEHGVLVAINKNDKTITRCSENSPILFNKTPDQLFDTNITTIISKTLIDPLLNESDDDVPNYVSTIINDIDVDVIVHRIDQEYIFDFEMVEERIDTFAQQQVLSKTINTISHAKNNNELNDFIAHTIQENFNYDRVMLYKFDHEWNGNIVAEAKQTELESWLGLQYPSTDIPVPARKIFLLEVVRMIKAVASPTFDIFSSNSVKQDIDLTKSELRAVSPIHIEYLNNMKVGATLTVPIVSGDTLWGLIACHHYSAKSISYNERMTCKFIAKFFANQVQINSSALLLERIKVSSLIRGELLNQIIQSWSINKGLTEYKYTLNDLTDSTGASICIDTELTNIGKCPADKQILNIVNHIRKVTNESTYYTNHLAEEFPEALAFKEIAAGVMCIFISESRSDALLWFKPELNETISWAGKPQDKSNNDENTRLTPRKSFELWQENQEGISNSWKDYEIAVAKEFRSNVMNFLSEKYDEIKLLNKKLKKAYIELESFSYSVSHDLRAPLRGIDGFAQIIKEDYYDSLDSFGKSSIETIINSVKKMNSLIDAILSYSGLEQKKPQYHKFKIKDVLEDEIFILKTNYPNTEITIDNELPNIYGDMSMIIMLIRNLLDNALKYSSKKDNPRVNIGVLENNIFYIQDNGIGFEQKHSEQIFRVFNRLNNDNFDGAGIGLSIVKRIIEKHDGSIWTESTLNEGATFYFNLNQSK